MGPRLVWVRGGTGKASSWWPCMGQAVGQMANGTGPGRSGVRQGDRFRSVQCHSFEGD